MIFKKAKEITNKLTLDEKIGMIHGAELFQTAGVPRLGIPPLKMSDGPRGIRQEFLPDRWENIGNSDDYVTYLPSGSALAATWNRELAEKMGSVLGEEARGRGKDVILAPSVNIKRSPLCGRNFEYFSEDPYLTAEMAVPYIRGIQKWDVAACVKHFAANNQETERLWVDVEIDEEVLRNIYLPAFYEAIHRGGSYTIMGAYNQIYGEHCCQSDFLLNQILRKEWGYDGVVISDWGAVHDTVKAANSQLDIEMSVTNDFDDYFMANPLKKKVETGEVQEKVIDEKVTRIIALMLRLHMLDGKRKSGTYNTPEHRQVTLEVARESIVLLKNEKNLLPLHKDNLHKVLVIGENANRIHSCGGGSAEVKALYEITPLMGLKTHLGGNVQMDYVPGYCSGKKVQDANWQEASLENGGGITSSVIEKKEAVKELGRLRKEAVSQAKKNYDAVIYVGGLSFDQDSEGNDRIDMKLPHGQDKLISELLDVRQDMIIVLIGGSAVEMNHWIDKASSLVWMYYAGMEGGNALADVVLGRVNPSGKLPETFYKTHKDCSAHCLGEFPGGKKVGYKEGMYVGYRYADKYNIEPQFPFGYGLSYTNFMLDKIEINDTEHTFSCSITNTGNLAGATVVMLYKSREDSELEKELTRFEKIYLEPGERKRVSFTLGTDERADYEVRGLSEP
ncbi:glycoside hydrolase family 3 C-terminal domain-containing protein [Blautia coccoides]|uniref:Glycoside hydrolase family 3 C-terminal domain-containing protein n=1 Tax=Blautia hominis TaxID=2025493 RepID=A0ABQ0BKN2_9FIRM|nr:glycoside hydrolase family 3 C-terminal domain-containing protein [Blautia coccoides]MCQ4640885.1 glycoside hydrolase family 3 C-terminal domain-containing protein [Blautia coccoides]